ncbi:MAG: VWA domain-containing protein [Armatimonadetes bacterium]|nr:VWA domain-containing protein [Armatimonadota bacterium]
MVAFSSASLGLAQDGVSTAGAARTRALGNAGLLPKARDVVVEDIVNYHRHEIGRPKAGESVALDVRWSSDLVSGDEAVLQVGLGTALAHDRQKLRPLNLSLVIDKSGSMSSSDKLSRVKTSLLNLVSRLRPTDILSIILFDSEAQVLFPAQKVRDGQSAMDLIRAIEPGSSTNIYAGLMLGYKEALKNFSRESTNRVILLTDGIANQGVTDPEVIAHDSKEYNNQGVDLSTIGVGLDLNRELLQDLSKSGRGLFHFVADSEDIEKVFVNELQSLLSPVATEPSLEIEFGGGLELDKVYGYDPKRSRGSVKIKLDNLNSGATEVVLMRFKVSGRDSMPVKVRLSYFDIDQNRRVETVQSAPVSRSGSDESVAKNYTIALLAQSIRDMAAACEGKHYREGENLLVASIKTANTRYPNMEDADVKRVYASAVKYRDLLREKFRGELGDDSRGDTGGKSIIANGDFTQGNTGFTSDRPYIKPSTNCLWDGYYTITSGFNTPVRLHTNVVDQPFSPPKGGNGLYMNTGGHDQFTVWSSKVSCKPRTTYRVSFDEIGLSGGAEWRNTYEIRINGERSEPQLGGDGQYVTVSYEWKSGSSKTATVSIVRMPNAHSGGVIGIGSIQMVPVGVSKGL